MNPDLHCHSTVSDGALEPEALAQRAADNGVTLWALTDHDELGGLARARAAAGRIGLAFVDGVEVSVSWANETVHIVGLGVDPGDQALGRGLAQVRSGRDTRAVEMGRQLEAVGIPGAYEGAMRYVSNPALVGRTHFARFLVEAGYCRNVADVFARFLAAGRPGFVPHVWARLDEAVGWIRGAGGIAIIAHPGRYRFDALERDAMIDAFIDAGGRGIEVVTGSHTPAQYLEYAEVARQRGLLASCGSDFHGDRESRIDLGGLPPLPAGLDPVWEALP